MSDDSDEYFFAIILQEIRTRQFDMVRMRDSIKNKTMEKTKIKQSVFPQLDTDFPSENFRYSRNAAKGVMMVVPVPIYEILTRESA